MSKKKPNEPKSGTIEIKKTQLRDNITVHVVANVPEPKLSKIDKANLLLNGLNTIILLVTVWVAVDIGRKQNAINQRMLDHNYDISLNVFFTEALLTLENKGLSNIVVRKVEIGDRKIPLDHNKFTLSPNTSYKFYSPQFDSLLIYIAYTMEQDFNRKKTLPEKEWVSFQRKLPLNIYLNSADKKSYVSENELVFTYYINSLDSVNLGYNTKNIRGSVSQVEVREISQSN